ncbi:MAG: ABC transporter ATP-binding protein [Planctomycetes bacterium]|nr:ABC transporter ATP-binding protein [Planctomycetota bacterium]
MIKITGLHKNLGGKDVLNGVDLEIKTGETMVILGGSGCGKSVLLKHITGLMAPDSGSIRFDDVELTALDEAGWNRYRLKFGMLFQGAALFDSMSVWNNVAFPLLEFTNKTREDVNRLVEEKLELVGLKEAIHKMPAELSGGMRKRAGLARAIVMEPQIILYDEPTTGLDPIMSDVINRLIRDLNKRLGVTAVVVTHDMESAYFVGDRMAMLYDGRVLETGTPDEMRKSSNDYVRQFINRQCYK